MASTNFDAFELIKAFLSVMEHDMLESGCFCRVSPYRPPNPHFILGGHEQFRSHVLFAKWMKNPEVFKRLIVNRELATTIRSKLFSKGLKIELLDAHDAVLCTLRNALRQLLAEPFDTNVTTNTIVGVNLMEMMPKDTSYRLSVNEVIVQNIYDLSTGRPCLSLTKHNIQTFVPGQRIRAMAEYTVQDGQMQLTEADLDSITKFGMDVLFPVTINELLSRKFWQEKNRNENMANNHRFMRDLDTTMSNNEGLFEGMLVPGAAQVVWKPDPQPLAWSC